MHEHNLHCTRVHLHVCGFCMFLCMYTFNDWLLINLIQSRGITSPGIAYVDVPFLHIPTQCSRSSYLYFTVIVLGSADPVFWPTWEEVNHVQWYINSERLLLLAKDNFIKRFVSSSFSSESMLQQNNRNVV